MEIHPVEFEHYIKLTMAIINFKQEKHFQRNPFITKLEKCNKNKLDKAH
jgi:hypothetical protein